MQRCLDGWVGLKKYCYLFYKEILTLEGADVSACFLIRYKHGSSMTFLHATMLLHLWVYSMMDFGNKIIAHSKLLVIKVLVNFFMKVTLILKQVTTNLLCVGNAHRESV